MILIRSEMESREPSKAPEDWRTPKRGRLRADPRKRESVLECVHSCAALAVLNESSQGRK